VIANGVSNPAKATIHSYTGTDRSMSNSSTNIYRHIDEIHWQRLISSAITAAFSIPRNRKHIAKDPQTVQGTLVATGCHLETP
jgi:hypothetical protein